MRPALALLGPSGSLASQVSTLGCVCYVADRLWYKTQFSSAAWICVFLIWAAAGRARSRDKRPGAARFGRIMEVVAVAACSFAVRAFSHPFSWRQAGGFGLLLLAALWACRLFLGLISRVRETDRWEGVRLGLAQALALFAVHPYVRSAILGAGDALSYSMMVADFRDQRRSGIFPVLIGQSSFAFNGGFQPLRNAPLFEHLAWLFDLLSLGTLNVFALQNLTVLASMLGAVIGCYAALRISLAKGPWLALGLAVLYGLCPGVLAPLYGGDMYITFMTLPFIPWLVLGLEQSAASPYRLWPWVAQGASLGGMWLAHPPVAAWATLVAAAAGIWTFTRHPKGRVAGGMLLAVAVLVALAGYLFVSVGSLGLPVPSRAEALASIDYKVATLHGDWINSFLPVDRNGAHLLGDVQLGYGLWACLLLSLAGAARLRSGRTLLGCFALILVFAWPIPVLTRWAWRSLPSELLVVTNQWPMERFYVLLAGLAVFIAAQGFSRPSFPGRRRRLALAALLLAACIWSATEARKFFRRAAEIGHSEAASEEMHLPENRTLSRTHSYEYLGMPAYYSNGHMDPRLETRLLDSATQLPFADGSSPRPGAAIQRQTARTLDLHLGADGVAGESLQVGPGQEFILRFDFLGHRPEGELQVKGGSLNEFYALPQSGMAKSFGSGTGASRTLILQNSTQQTEAIGFRFLGNEGSPGPGSFARVSVEALSKPDRAVRLVSSTPFHASVTVERPCYLETPQLFVPGYQAFVDGVRFPVTKGPNGLVEVPLNKGDHDVIVVYVGGRLLRWSYVLSASAWLVLFALVGACALQLDLVAASWLARMLTSLVGPLRPRSTGWKYVYALPGAAVLAVSAVFLVKSGVFSRTSYGAIQMLIKLPPLAIGLTEPLVTTGHTGSGDFVYVTYVDGGHILVGHDKWNYGGGKSGLIAVDYLLPQTVEAGLSSLFPGASGPKKVFVKWNGVVVYSEDVAAYPSKPDEVTVGQNAIGGSTTLPHFSGEILDVSRPDAGTTK